MEDHSTLFLTIIAVLLSKMDRMHLVLSKEDLEAIGTKYPGHQLEIEATAGKVTLAVVPKDVTLQ